MRFPIDPGFPGTDEDAQYLHALRDTPVRPIFIMGLHRSGTTFLYDSVAHCFPVANLSLYHLFYYRRLLRNHHEGGESRDRERLNRAFRALGITNRKIDNVWVDDTMVEEYGWLLRQRSYHISIHETNRPFFDEICRKLLYVTPGAQAVLLKNPWDTGNARQILQWFPDARFLYITREPIYLLNSLINAALALTRGAQPFQTMLVDDFRMPGGKATMQGLYGAWKAVRGLRTVVGDRLSATLLRPFAARIIRENLTDYYRDLQELPADRALQLDYRQFTQDPATHMVRIRDFLALPFKADPSEIKPRPRKGHLDPRLAAYEEKFTKMLERRIGGPVMRTDM